MNTNRNDDVDDGARRDAAPVPGAPATEEEAVGDRPTSGDTTALPTTPATPASPTTQTIPTTSTTSTTPTLPETGSTAYGTAGDRQVWSATTAPAAPAPRGVRTGTLILGLVLALAGFGALVTGLGYRLDLQLSVIVVLVVAALALLLVPLLQRGRRERDDEPAT